jgi:hypothetical protein
MGAAHPVSPAACNTPVVSFPGPVKETRPSFIRRIMASNTEITDRTKVSLGVLLGVVGAFGMGVVSLIRSNEALSYARRDIDSTSETVREHDKRLALLERTTDRLAAMGRTLDTVGQQMTSVLVILAGKHGGKLPTELMPPPSDK